jgi:hypothetical protein
MPRGASSNRFAAHDIQPVASDVHPRVDDGGSASGSSSLFAMPCTIGEQGMCHGCFPRTEMRTPGEGAETGGGDMVLAR